MLNETKLPKVSVVILNWNGSHDTIECVNSLLEITYSNFEIIIVDNNSKILDSKNLKKLSDEKITIIFNNENLGFSGGNNVGIQIALKNNSDYILLLNNDTVVETNFLEPLIQNFSNYNNLGISAPQINYFGDKEQIWSIGGMISKIRGSGFNFSPNNAVTKNKSEYLTSFVSGCCMLIKSEIFEKIGYLDEAYFLYLEDTDYCFRVTNHGFKIAVTKKSKIYHKVSQSTMRDNNLLHLYYTTRNRLYFSKRNLGKFFLFPIIYIFWGTCFKSLYWLTRGEYKKVKVVIKAFNDFSMNKMGIIDNSI